MLVPAPDEQLAPAGCVPGTADVGELQAEIDWPAVLH